jgi:hypothetical protein
LPNEDRRAWVDASLAAQLRLGLDTAGFMHLPIAGVPGWWEGQDAAFYTDTAVFRPLRSVFREPL